MNRESTVAANRARHVMTMVLVGWMLTNGPFEAQAAECCPFGQTPGVYFVRGGLGYWPRVRKFACATRTRGYRTQITRVMQIGRTARYIKKNHGCAPIIIVGYSSGGDSACLICRRLRRAGIPVDTLILIESTMGVAVPDNVQYCFNIYKSNPRRDWIPFLRGLPVAADGCTQLINVDVRYTPQFAAFCEYPHLRMATAPDVQQMLVRLIDARHGCLEKCQSPQPGLTADESNSADDVEPNEV